MRKNVRENETKFEWQGFTFLPVRPLNKKEKRKGLNLELGWDLSLSSVFSNYDGGLWNYEEFYNCAGGLENCKADVFFCEETGAYYIPGKNELFVYHE